MTRRSRPWYSWDLETVDPEFGDILDHSYSDVLKSNMLESKTTRLCVVRDIGNAHTGHRARAWAYVIDGVLQTYFKDGLNKVVAKVPERYVLELKAYYSWLKAKNEVEAKGHEENGHENGNSAIVT